MPNAAGPVELVKKAAVEAVEAAKPVALLTGLVTDAEPLRIMVDQKLVLHEGELLLSRNVTDYTVSMTVDHQTEEHGHTHTITDTYTGGGGASLERHTHGYRGTKEFRVHNRLKQGETVLLARIQGGRRYAVLDRLGGAR